MFFFIFAVLAVLCLRGLYEVGRDLGFRFLPALVSVVNHPARFSTTKAVICLAHQDMDEAAEPVKAPVSSNESSTDDEVIADEQLPDPVARVEGFMASIDWKALDEPTYLRSDKNCVFG